MFMIGLQYRMFSMISAWCLLVCVSLGIRSMDASEELIFTQILYRHGDRAPYYSYPKNPVPPTFWPQGLEQLTQVGMEQQYDLGRYIRGRYVEGNPYTLLNGSYKHEEIYVRSTDVDRTLMSAYSNLAGLYPPAGRQVWNADIKWQPIPVHTIPALKDHLLNMEVKCQRYDEIYQEVLNSEEVQKEEASNQVFYEYLKDNTGLQDENITLIWELYDTLLCQRSHNISLPDWAARNWTDGGESVYNKMGKLYGLSFGLQFNSSDEQRRLRGGSLLKHIIDQMRLKIDSDNAPTASKMNMFSAHDDTIVGLLSAMSVYNGIAPPYASAVIVELFEVHDNTGNYFIVQFLYRNDSTREPYRLEIPGCSTSCNLDTFIKLTKTIIPNDWVQECTSIDDGFDGIFLSSVVTIFVVLFTLLFAVLLYTVCVRRRQNGGGEYKKILDI